MKISGLLERDTIELNLKAKGEAEAIRELLGILHKTRKINDPEQVAPTLFGAGQVPLTTLGNEVAIYLFSNGH
jgi:hypothetical protein